MGQHLKEILSLVVTVNEPNGIWCKTIYSDEIQTTEVDQKL